MPVIADLGEDAGAGGGAEAGEAGDDGGVGVLPERILGCLEQLVDSSAGCVELQQQCVHLLPERGLDDRRVLEVGCGEDGVQPVGPWL